MNPDGAGQLEVALEVRGGVALDRGHGRAVTGFGFEGLEFRV